MLIIISIDKKVIVGIDKEIFNRVVEEFVVGSVK